MSAAGNLVNSFDKFDKSISKNNSLVCVGLDPQIEKLPKKFKKSPSSIFPFNKYIIDSTSEFTAAYKPNIAFYEAYGIEGLKQLKLTIDYIQKKYSKWPILLDAKRGDVPNTAKMYAKAIFMYWGVDAVTVYPNLGQNATEPFLEYKDKLTILLIKTSNSDSGTFQNLKIAGDPYYLKMAKVISTWKAKNFGLMVGATYPNELKELRKIFPTKLFLSPGIGAQAGDIKNAVRVGMDKNKKGIIFNASRSIIYSESPQKAAQSLRDEINSHR